MSSATEYALGAMLLFGIGDLVYEHGAATNRRQDLNYHHSASRIAKVEQQETHDRDAVVERVSERRGRSSDWEERSRLWQCPHQTSPPPRR